MAQSLIGRQLRGRSSTRFRGRSRIFGREMPIPRMTAWFGDGAYSYSGILHLPAPFPAIIERLRERAEALSGVSFNAALANLYRAGRDSVGWHSDNEAGLGNRPTIASLSLGENAGFNSGIGRRSKLSRLD